MNDKAMLMNRIQVCTFNLDELVLFLDTHPDSKEAMDLFMKYKALLEETRMRYIQSYGPLSTYDFDGIKWKWVESPWPWELSEV
ncbi:MAG: spore coat protein CotJB [Oscillospiraceae bacterium]